MTWSRCIEILNRRETWLDYVELYNPACMLPNLNNLMQRLASANPDDEPDTTLYWCLTFLITISIIIGDAYFKNDSRPTMTAHIKNKYEDQLKLYGCDDEAADYYLCPIYKRIMVEPVIPLVKESNGTITKLHPRFALDKSSYELIIKKGDGLCPFTRRPYAGFVPYTKKQIRIKKWVNETIKNKKKRKELRDNYQAAVLFTQSLGLSKATENKAKKALKYG